MVFLNVSDGKTVYEYLDYYNNKLPKRLSKVTLEPFLFFTIKLYVIS